MSQTNRWGYQCSNRIILPYWLPTSKYCQLYLMEFLANLDKNWTGIAVMLDELLCNLNLTKPNPNYWFQGDQNPFKPPASNYPNMIHSNMIHYLIFMDSLLPYVILEKCLYIRVKWYKFVPWTTRNYRFKVHIWSQESPLLHVPVTVHLWWMVLLGTKMSCSCASGFECLHKHFYADFHNFIMTACVYTYCVCMC